MSDKTINEVLVLMKVIRERIKDLKELRLKTSVKEVYYSTTEKTIEPQYSIRELDKKITGLQNFLFIADSTIKMSNARVLISLEIDMDELLKPLE